MKKIYTSPVLAKERFETADVITASLLSFVPVRFDERGEGALVVNVGDRLAE